MVFGMMKEEAQLQWRYDLKSGHYRGLRNRTLFIVGRFHLVGLIVIIGQLRSTPLPVCTWLWLLDSSIGRWDRFTFVRIMKLTYVPTVLQGKGPLASLRYWCRMAEVPASGE